MAPATLVFLEHHDGALQKGSLGVLGKAASLGGDVGGVVLGAGVREAAAQAGKYGASTVYVFDDPALEAPLPQPRVDALEALVRQTGAQTVLFAASVLSADVAAGLAAAHARGRGGTRVAKGASGLCPAEWRRGRRPRIQPQ